MTKKTTVLFLIVSILLCFIFLWSISLGPANISFKQSIVFLLQKISLHSDLDIQQWQSTILQEIRLPRSLLSVVVGASLACCGTVMQSLFRNPLASPSIIGVSSGASLGAVIAIFLGFAALNFWALPLFAFIGSGLSLFFVYTLSTRQGHTPMGTLLLAGIAVAAFNTAMSALVLALSLQEWEIGKAIVFWSMGGLDGRSWAHVFLLSPIFVTCFIFIISFYRDLDILLLGEVHAASVGVDIEKTRLILLTVTALLIACSVSVAGGIAFIGLVIPHIARLLIGHQHVKLIPFATLLGGFALLLADCLLRSQIEFSKIPLGVVTASIGAPFFLYLLFKQRSKIRL